MFLYFIYDAYTELFTSVSNGKSAIASAITDKGVSTASDATFQTMSNNIRSIPSPTAYATILSNHAQYNMTVARPNPSTYTLSLPIENIPCNTYEIISFPTVTSLSSSATVGYTESTTDFNYYINHIKVVKGSNSVTTTQYVCYEDGYLYSSVYNYKKSFGLQSITITYSNNNLNIEYKPSESSGRTYIELYLRAGDWLVVGY